MKERRKVKRPLNNSLRENPTDCAKSAVLRKAGFFIFFK
jgi:hypothetical protein